LRRRRRQAGQVAHVGTIKMHVRFWLRNLKKNRPHGMEVKEVR